MKKFLFPLIALALSLTSCQSDIDILNEQPELDTPDFTATISDETRTHSSIGESSFKVLWNETDEISIYSKADHNLCYDVSSLENNGNYATFSYTYEFVRGTGTRYSYYYAAYPWSENNKIVDEVIQMDLPATQVYDATNDFSYVPMVAKSTVLNLPFKVPGSTLCVAINKEDVADEFRLMSVNVASSSVDLAGRIAIDMSGTEFKAYVDPSLGDTSKSVTLDLGEGVVLSTDVQNFSLALPEVVFPENDFVVTCQLLVNGESRVLKVTREQSLNFEAGHVKRLKVNVLRDSFVGNGGGIIDGTIEIEDDMIVDEPLVVPSGGSATIHLGGSISPLPTNPNSALIVVEEGAELTIEGDGSITTETLEPSATALSATRAASNTAFPIVINGTLTIKGGDYTLNSFATSWLNCGIYIGPNGKIVVEGGTFRSTKGSYIIGHELGNRPQIEIHGGRFEGYDPSDNDFDGEGSNYLEPEYASYYVAADELVVATRDQSWDVDNNYLLTSILKNGGTANLVAPANGDAGFVVSEPVVVGYPVAINGEQNLYLDYTLICEANVSFDCDYVESMSAIATVRSGATLTLNDATYIGGVNGTDATLFTAAGGNIVVNDGTFSIDGRVETPEMFVIDANYADSSSIEAINGNFYGFDPAQVICGDQTVSGVTAGKHSILWVAGDHYKVKYKGTYTAATYNVDGLPSLINSNGPGSNGTITISSRLAQDGWDIIAFQEDFEYDAQLQSNMTSTYKFGTYRGSVGINALWQADTDGLNFATKISTTTFSGETFVEFTDAYGGLRDGANTCIKKGFRYYLVTLPNGVQIDVIVTHMNSGSDEGHINARASQFKQLANYINAMSGDRPILLLGDFNARYTRDDYATNFWSVLDANAYLSDAWVDLWDKTDISENVLYAAGEYPAYGTNSLVVDDKYDAGNTVNDIHCTEQGGEVVDKVMYINRNELEVAMFAETFVRDIDYTEADHVPSVAQFSYYY